MIEIVGPLGIAQQIGAADLDLHDHHPPLCVDPHQVGPAAIAQRHFGQAPDAVAGKQPADPRATANASRAKTVSSPGPESGPAGESGESGESSMTPE
jgi:hypothetical protein